jgi:starch synthase
LVHLHDWHSALAALYLKKLGPNRPKTVLTIHNLAFQGIYPTRMSRHLNLVPDEIEPRRRQEWEQICFLGEGIIHSDRVTTVSPNYAREIMTEELGFGLERLLHQRQDEVIGILNGVDYQTWCPEQDPHLPLQEARFDADAKRRCKHVLQSRLGLAPSDRPPMIAFTNRIAEQKMIDVIIEVMPAFLKNGAQLVVHGDGERRFMPALKDLAAAFPEQVALVIGHRQELEHLIHAGSDICLSPSRFEPCGLNPLYAMRYGAIPVVRRVGGLVDSIVDATPEAIANGRANGIMFDHDDPESLKAAIERALACFADGPVWAKLRANAQSRKYLWKDSIERYLAIYRELSGLSEQPACTPLRARSWRRADQSQGSRVQPQVPTDQIISKCA